jgi:phosphoglucosamine mutase
VPALQLGQGLATALQVLAVMQDSGEPLSSLVAGMQRLPQIMINVKVAHRIDVGASTEIQAAVRSVEAEMGERGRVVLRAYGTEPVIRVMVEAEDRGQAQALAARLADTVQAAAEH